MGEGRNSIFLARLGWEVTGFDVSEVALANARANAEKAGVRVRTVQCGYQEFNFGHGKWDLIAMMYAYFPIRETQYVERLVESLRPGALLVFQHRVLKRGEDEQGMASWIGIPGEDDLKEIFRSLRVLRYEEVEELSDWQTGPVARKHRMVKMLSKKP
jgi:SAM-dependent methyltransferase